MDLGNGILYAYTLPLLKELVLHIVNTCLGSIGILFVLGNCERFSAYLLIFRSSCHACISSSVEALSCACEANTSVEKMARLFQDQPI